MRFAISILGTEVFKVELGEPELTVEEMVQLTTDLTEAEDDESEAVAYGFASTAEETLC